MFKLVNALLLNKVLTCPGSNWCLVVFSTVSVCMVHSLKIIMLVNFLFCC